MKDNTAKYEDVSCTVPFWKQYDN